MELADFDDLWEHLRLLSDERRTGTLVELLRRHARGARVLEVGCGTGLLSCVAARLGASKVYAVEQSPRWTAARDLVRRSGLSKVVTVMPGIIEEVEPKPVDLAFSELLNADPMAEGLLSAMDAAGAWVVEGGMLAPSRLRIQLALVTAPEVAEEAGRARAVIERLGQEFRLDVEPLLSEIATVPPSRFLAPQTSCLGSGVTVWECTLGQWERPPDSISISLPVERSGTAGGAVAWFEADYDADLQLHNRPGEENHWGNLVNGWARAVAVRAGESLPVRVRMDEDEGIVVELVEGGQ